MTRTQPQPRSFADRIAMHSDEYLRETAAGLTRDGRSAGNRGLAQTALMERDLIATLGPEIAALEISRIRRARLDAWQRANMPRSA